MKTEDIDRVLVECDRFMRRAQAAWKRLQAEEKADKAWNKEYDEKKGMDMTLRSGCSATREVGALKRASLDLSAELVRLRR
jgi:hypothetical protein